MRARLFSRDAVAKSPCKRGSRSEIYTDGKKHPRNVYAHSKEECERLLAEMIQEVKAEIAAEKELLNLSKQAG